jgi:hypothetical protein
MASAILDRWKPCVPMRRDTRNEAGGLAGAIGAQDVAYLASAVGAT